MCVSQGIAGMAGNHQKLEGAKKASFLTDFAGSMARSHLAFGLLAS